MKYFLSVEIVFWVLGVLLIGWMSEADWVTEESDLSRSLCLQSRRNVWQAECLQSSVWCGVSCRDSGHPWCQHRHWTPLYMDQLRERETRPRAHASPRQPSASTVWQISQQRFRDCHTDYAFRIVEGFIKRLDIRILQFAQWQRRIKIKVYHPDFQLSLSL